MQANYQNSGMDDIIFENRNKAYGAYVLRRDYNKSLQQAIIITLTTITLLFIGNYLYAKLSPVSTAKIEKETELETADINTTQDITPPPVKEEITPPPPPANDNPPPVNTTNNAEFLVQQDNNLASDSIPTHQELELAANLGTQTTTTGVNTGGTINEAGKGEAAIGKAEGDPIVIGPEEMPKFPGGERALMKFLVEQTQYPRALRDMDVTGKAFVRFVVNKDGSVSNAEVIKCDGGTAFGSEAMRVVNMLPKFTPGRQGGHAVRVQMVLPFKFTTTAH